MYSRIKSRAKLEKLPFNLTLDDIVIPDFCPVLNIPIFVGTENVGPNSPTVDRLIPNKGYVKGNIAIISHKANTIKNNATLEELIKVSEWLSKVINE